MANITVTHELDKLVRAFERAPIKTRDMVRLQVKMATRDVQEEARGKHRYITRSGMLEKSVSTHVQDNRGIVFLDERVARYGVFIHTGTKAHEIKPKNKLALRWVSGNGFAFAKCAKVKGIKADPFLYNAAEVCEPKIQQRFATALDVLLNEVLK